MISFLIEPSSSCISLCEFSAREAEAHVGDLPRFGDLGLLQPDRLHALLTEEADAVADEDARDIDEDGIA
jgi:hypothetical protein